jgi:HAD superfamily hydrolase (TIGR01549 family)
MNTKLIAPPEPYAALIFDCDGTLADTMPNHYQAWLGALHARGAALAEDRFYSMGGIPTDEIIRILNRDFGYTLDVADTHHDKETRYLDLLQSIEEITAVADIARANFGKVPMAVASGGMRHVVEKTLKATDLYSLFPVIVTADDVEHGKPSPDIFLLAAERMGVAPADCIVYEDGEVGIEAARRAGMRCVDVRVLWAK